MTDLTKPVRRVARHVPSAHGIADSIVITVYPGGVIGLRELRRRDEERVTRDQMIRARTCPHCGGQLKRRICCQSGACGTDWSNVKLTPRRKKTITCARRRQPSLQHCRL